MQQLGVQAAVELPFIARHEPLLVQAPRKDFCILVPGAVEHPATAESAHPAHAREACREKMQLEMERVRAHLVGTAVKTLEPRIVSVDALESQLQAESRGERARQSRLTRADHTSDANQHGSQGKNHVPIFKRLFASCN